MASRLCRVTGLGVAALIPGTISRPLEAMFLVAGMLAVGMKVCVQTCGVADEVLRAFLAKKLTGQAFVMPKCCGGLRHLRFGGDRPACGSGSPR